MKLANLHIGEIFLYVKGAADLHLENTYWIKVAECFDPYGKYLGCRCVQILKGSGIVLDEEMLSADFEVIQNED